mgnify:CR=1 FL=1
MLQKDVIRPNRDDANYVRMVTQRVPADVVNLMHSAYCEAWITAYNDEQLEHKKENAGRFAANTLIRKLARQYMETGSIHIPRICGNCDKCETWNGQYYCHAFEREIPIEFVKQENECEQYENEIPF